jgi:membrane-bound metal-dependent hydrolase YbcI (DUF457 family)
MNPARDALLALCDQDKYFFFNHCREINNSKPKKGGIIKFISIFLHLLLWAVPTAWGTTWWRRVEVEGRVVPYQPRRFQQGAHLLAALLLQRVLDLLVPTMYK